MKAKVSTILTLVAAALIFIGLTALMTVWPALTVATPAPMPTIAGRRFDDASEMYLWGVEQNATGQLVSASLRAGFLRLEWVDTLGGLKAISDPGVIRLARDQMQPPDPETFARIKAVISGKAVATKDLGPAIDQYVADCAVVVHEIAHQIFGDPKVALPETDSPDCQRAEWRVRVVELKWVCEMLAHIRGEAVDYYHPEAWEVYLASMPPDPTDMDGLLVGAQPDDPALARQLLAFPAK